MLGIISILIWIIGVIVCGVYNLWGDAICNWYWNHFSSMYQFVGIPDKGVFYQLQNASVICMEVLLVLMAVAFAILYFRSK